MKKRIIFHLPLKIDPNRYSASQIRPIKMLQAFESIGYDVDVVMGYANERKASIKRIKKNIEDGVKYDFMYSESSTMPTLLTERHHYPTHPFLDFNFFKFCKNNGIKIGLFYRDIYWCFPENIVSWKNKVAKYFYHYDLQMYNKYIDVLFVPSVKMVKYLPVTLNLSIIGLPSGATLKFFPNNESNDKIINMIYVGGFGKGYEMETLFKVIKNIPSIKLTICCREDDWNMVKETYEPLLSSNISIIHKHGEDLERLYGSVDLCSLFVEPSIYRTFAMPFKLIEYIGHGCPVLASQGTLAADYITENKVGVVAKYDCDSLSDVLSSLTKKEIKKLKHTTREFALTQTWNERARTVVHSLTV